MSAYLTESVEYAVSEYTEETCIPKERSIASNKELINRADLELSLHREERNQVKDLFLNKTRHNIKDEEVKKKMV